MKKLIAMIMALCMLATMIPLGVTAVDDDEVSRDIVLLLDNSVSLEGTPLEYLKTAAKNFCASLFEASGNNRLAIVTYGTYVENVYSFSTDLEMLQSVIDNMDGEGSWTNIDAAANRAYEMLSESTADIRNMVILTDGLPTYGKTEYDGRYDRDDYDQYYSYTGHYVFEFANALYTDVVAMHPDCNVYTFGFFHNMTDEQYAFGTQLLKDLQNAGYYEVTDPEELEFVFGDVVDDMTAKAYPFNFTGHLVADDVSGTCYYTDGYFRGDAAEYDSHLATMSLCFELTTWSRYVDEAGWTTQVEGTTDAAWQNAYDLLVGQLGFEDFAVNEFWENEPTKDSIGAVAATKELANNNGTLIALGVRGGGYGQEWASNFTVGDDGEHDGFAEAKNNVLNFLKEYIADHNITGEIKIWLVGYSRAGCVANMVAGEINDGYNLGNGATVSHDDLFAYTFEAPQGTTKSNAAEGDYANIHNIINLNDIVPMVAPSSWGFARYNTDYWLPSAATSESFSTQLANMKSQYSTFEGDTDYKILEWGVQYDSIEIDWTKILPGGDPMITLKYHKIPTNRALTDSAAFLFDDAIGDRYTYYTDFQAGVREIMSLLYGGKLSDLLEDGMSIDTFFTKFFGELTADRVIDIVSPMFALNFDSLTTRLSKVEDKLEDFVKGVLNDSDLWGTVAFTADLGDTLCETLWRIVKAVAEDLFNKDTTTLQSLLNLIIMIQEGSVAQAHYPEVTLAWMMSQDSYYQEGPTDSSNSSYRVIHINCPVDVNVYKAGTNDLVASIVDDAAQTVEGSSIYAYLNADGEKIVVLPSDGDYTVDISATDTGTLNYTIEEFNLDSLSNTRIINYYDVNITAGDKLTADIPALDAAELEAPIPEGSSAAYTLCGSDGTVIAPDAEMVGTAAEEACYTVSVTRSNDGGSVSGGGTYSQGRFAEVTAIPAAGAEFVGWYQNGILVSNSPSYRFAVTEDVTMEAKFGEAKTYVLTVNAAEGGSVSNQQVSVPAGSQIQLEAIAGEGYSFAGWSADIGEFEDSASATTWFTMPEGDVTVNAAFAGGAAEPLLGDVDGNGAVDYFDALYILQYYSGLIDKLPADS